MSDLFTPQIAHPLGEASTPPTDPWPIDTPGGRFRVEWDTETPVSLHGQLPFFAQFLYAGQRWQSFLADCPLNYTGNRGSGSSNVIGTAVLSVLYGHWRYLHINAVRSDGINGSVLGIDRIVSDSVIRNAFNHRIDHKSALDWLHEHLRLCLEPMLHLPWILDIDSTIKPIYGHQEGAEIGYNPTKPGRPSHVYYSYFVANLRLCLGVDVLPGKQNSAKDGKPGLWRVLKAYPRTHWPAFIRGDCAHGAETFLSECEAENVPYLCKLRITKRVRELLRIVRDKGSWQSTGDGWEAIESTLKLSGWSKARRVIVVRELGAKAPVPENPAHVAKPGKRRGKDRDTELGLLPGATGEGWKSPAPWSGKISVLVTSLDSKEYPTVVFPKQYRDRGDMENNYDELKNQWGWNGYTTRKLGPCRIMANLIALVFNWWGLYVRLFDEDHHREAITTRPALLNGAARQVKHAGQRVLKISILHENGDIIEKAIEHISNMLQGFITITERWSPQDSWALLLTRIFRKKLGGKWLANFPPEASVLLSG